VTADIGTLAGQAFAEGGKNHLGYGRKAPPSNVYTKPNAG